MYPCESFAPSQVAKQHTFKHDSDEYKLAFRAQR